MPVQTHELDDIETLLPFYVNDTLDADERADVDAAIAKNPDLQEDVSRLASLRDAMQSLETGPTPGEFGLARLMREIEAPAPVVTKPAALPWSIAAAAVAGFLAIGVLWISEPGTDTFTQASGDAGVMALTVAFHHSATQVEVSELLLNLGLEISGGPSALGLYRLALPDGVDADAVAAELAARQDLVESVALP